MRCLILPLLVILLICSNVLAGFNGYVKADTQVIVTIGPFVDVGDGFTPQTDIGNPNTNLTGVDEAELLKHGSVTTVDITARTWAAIASVDGYYGLTLTTDDTNTEGMLTVIIQDDSDCLPVRCTFMVMNDNTFEAFFENAAEILTVNTTEVNGTGQTANDNGADINTIVTAVGNIETDTAAYDTDDEYATAIWEARINDYSGPVTFGQVVEDILMDTGTTLDDLIDTEIGTIATAVSNIETDTEAWDTAGEATSLLANVTVDMVKIHGSALTETHAGDLADSFTFFFDVDPVTTKTVDDVGAVASCGGSSLVLSVGDVGNFKEDSVVAFTWRSIDQGGAAVNPSTAGIIKIYKEDSDVEVTSDTGMTDTRGFDGLTGIHLLVIDLNANTFYERNKNYSVVLTGATVDSQATTAVIATFSIEKRYVDEFDRAG